MKATVPAPDGTAERVRWEALVARPLVRPRALAGWLLPLAAVVLGALTLLPAALGLGRHTILTGSMAPALPPGTLVLSRPVPVAEVRPGDVVTFRPPPGSDLPGTTTHRVAVVGPGGTLTTRGDANARPDRPSFRPAGGRIARVELAVPHAGAVLTALGGETGRRLLVVLPALLIALGAVARIWHEAGEGA